MLVERSSMSAVADEGMELTEVPPEMWPTLSVVTGALERGRSAMSARARLRRRMGLGAPASDHEWPPGPVMVTRKRRLPRARVTTAGGPAAFESDGGSDAASIGAAFEEVAHAAEVAFALFAYVGGEEDCDGRMDAGIAKRRLRWREARTGRRRCRRCRGSGCAVSQCARSVRWRFRVERRCRDARR